MQKLFKDLQSSLNEVEMVDNVLDGLEGICDVKRSYRRLFEEKAKEEPSRLAVATLLKRARQRTATLADSESNPVQSRTLQKLQKKREDEKEEEKAVPMPKSVPDVGERKIWIEQQAARTK